MNSSVQLLSYLLFRDGLSDEYLNCHTPTTNGLVGQLYHTQTPLLADVNTSRRLNMTHTLQRDSG